MKYSSTYNPAAWISEIITDFIHNSPDNYLPNGIKEKIWDKPLVGFSRGDDPLYQEFRNHIGNNYLLPPDFLQKKYQDVHINTDDLTVISWILPQTEKTKREQRQSTQYPSETWARVRVTGEGVNQKVRKLVVDSLQKAGYHAVAPLLSPDWKLTYEQGYAVSSLWSERHAAYVCGLGTFGLCDGLITPIGKAMRCGSVITTLSIPASVRNYASRNEYCPFFTGGSCGICIDRCPARAISNNGHDKKKCAAYIREITGPYIAEMYGVEGDACGLCQTGVPCESGIPNRKTGT